MSTYRFGKYGSFQRDDHPLALYAGKVRLSPWPVLVWWWPWNWVLVAAFLPVAVVTALRKRWSKPKSPQ